MSERGAGANLYNYRDRMSTTLDPRGNSWSKPRPNIGPYGGGSEALTDSVRNDPRINTQMQHTTNAPIRVTMNTRTRDQTQVNQHQIVFIDTEEFDKPVMMSIVQINQALCGGLAGSKHSEAKFLKCLNYTKADVKDRFKLFGAVVNRDGDTNDSMPITRLARSTTLTVKGDAHVMDYWSRKAHRLRRYDLCYFVLKKVFITDEYTFQTFLTARRSDVGVAPHPKAIGKYVWQVLPYHTRDRTIKPEAYSSLTRFAANGSPVPANDNTPDNYNVNVVGTYWRIGFTHEYATISPLACFDMRAETSVARDMAHLHQAGTVQPMQFYIWFDDGSKLI
jgi:hypothetical protein